MIKSFNHKGLKELFEKGKSKHIAPDFSRRAYRQLNVINEAEQIAEINLPGYDLHELGGDRKGTWSVKVNKNWRLTFNFEAGDASNLDLEDYH